MKRRAWITGASSGIGRAVALRLARDGWLVAASARDGDAMRTLADEAREAAGAVEPWPLDVTDADATVRAAAGIETTHGALDLVIFNAGTHKPMGAADFDPQIVRTLLDVNLMGVANGLAAVLPGFLRRRSGQIMVVASLAGYRGLPTAAAYGASKAGLINMAEALRPELARQGVTLTLVNPGFVRTPLTDLNTFEMPFLMEVEAAADRIVAAIGSRRFEVVFPRRFAWLLKVARCLPYAVYFAIVGRLRGNER